MNATGLIIAELVRLGCTYTEGEPEKLIDLEMLAINDGVSRSRAAARYAVRVSLSWVPSLGALSLVDTRGYPVAWSFEAVGKWLSKSLSGARCVVSLSIDDAAKLPARWTPSRIAAQADKIGALDAAAIRADAAAKRATAETWTPGDRRAAVLAASLRMEDCAYLVDVLAGVETLPGYVPPEPTPAPTPEPTPAPTPEPGAVPVVVTLGTSPGKNDAYFVAVPVQVDGVGAWWFASLSIAGGNDAGALAWFDLNGGAAVIARCSEVPGSGGVVPAAGVLFRADGVPMRRWVDGVGFDAPGVDPWSCLYFDDTYGAAHAADRFGDGDYSGAAGVRGWMAINTGYWGAAVWEGRRALMDDPVTDGTVNIDLSGTTPDVLLSYL